MQETRAAILSAIAAGPVSGPSLAERLDVSRTAIWKHIESLRDTGFEIESSDQGYELTSVPEFGADAIEFGLEAPFEIECHDAIESTNARARTLAADGAADRVVIADRQTGGRGRLDREWQSPSGGVWLSIISRPAVPPSRTPLYTLAGAVATAQAAREAGVAADIKWPNDVLVDERKLAGILTEMEGEADRVSWLVVGIGVNANVDPAALPAGVAATSLRSERGEDVNRRRFIQRLLERFHELRADPDSILSAWRKLSITLGQTVRVETPTDTVEGVAVDVVDAGALVLDTGDDEVVVTAGDCEHLRAADG